MRYWRQVCRLALICRPLCLPLCLTLCGCGQLSGAHGFSTTDWTIGSRVVELRVSLPDDAVRPLAGGSSLADYVLAHVDVHAGAVLCPPLDQGQDIGLIDTLAPQPGQSDYFVIFECPLEGARRLDDHMLFELDPLHLDFARLRSAGHATVTRFFEASRQSILLRPDNTAEGASAIDYVATGMRHLFVSLIRIGCVLVICAGLRRRLDWLGAALALVGGYAISMMLGANGVFEARPQAAEPVIGLLAVLLSLRGNRFAGRIAAGSAVVLLGLAFIESQDGHGQGLLLLGAAILAPSLLLSTQSWLWLIPPFLFGLLDGAAFGNAVHTLALPGWAAAWPRFGYAAGGAIAAGLLGALARPMRRRISASLGAIVACYGAIWFASHIHG